MYGHVFKGAGILCGEQTSSCQHLNCNISHPRLEPLSQGQVKTAYRKCALTVHPDKNSLAKVSLAACVCSRVRVLQRGFSRADNRDPTPYSVVAGVIVP